jgi:hypothetical protein
LPSSGWESWHPRRLEWTAPFHSKTKTSLCAIAIMFRTSYTSHLTFLRQSILEVTPYNVVQECQRHITNRLKMATVTLPHHKIPESTSIKTCSYLTPYFCSPVSSHAQNPKTNRSTNSNLLYCTTNT